MSSSKNDVEALESSSVRVLFGQRIRELRKAKGYSQERFAMASGLDRSYYGSVERGERNVSLDNISAIAQALEEPIYKLFAET
jgi:transcriptional regulator with XRE-family HTH domain